MLLSHLIRDLSRIMADNGDTNVEAVDADGFHIPLSRVDELFLEDEKGGKTCRVVLLISED